MKVVEDYLHDLRGIHYSDVGTGELTYYHPLSERCRLLAHGPGRRVGLYPGRLPGD
jgi:hypothetical protein